MNSTIKTLIATIALIIFILTDHHNVSNYTLDSSLINPRVKPSIVHLNIDDNLKKQLLTSKVYNDACERNAIILFDGETITDGESSKNTLEEFRNRDNGTFCVYKFYSHNNSPDESSCYIYKKEDKEISVGRIYYKDWENILICSDYKIVDNLEINEYGYLAVSANPPKQSLASKVINDIEIYENADELTSIYKKYVSPILVDLREGLYFTDISDIDAYWMGLFESFYRHENPSEYLSDKYYCNLIPLEDIHLYLKNYFDVTLDELHLYLSDMPKDYFNYYISNDQTLHYGAGRNKHYPNARITDYSWQDDLLNITVQLCAFDGEPTGCDIVIKVRLNEDGSFKYLSVMPAEKVAFYNKFSKEELSFIKDVEHCFNKAVPIFNLYDYPTVIDHARFYRCINFDSIDELKTYVESVFSKDLCTYFLSKDFSPDVFYAVRKNYIPKGFITHHDKLYVSEFEIDKGWFTKIKDNTIKILSLNDKNATISADFLVNDEEIETVEFLFVYENNRWLLDTYYNYNKK